MVIAFKPSTAEQSQSLTCYTTPAQDIVGEIDELRGDAFRASEYLKRNYPTAAEYDAALRAISDCQQRLDYVVDLLRAEINRA